MKAKSKLDEAIRLERGLKEKTTSHSGILKFKSDDFQRLKAGLSEGSLESEKVAIANSGSFDEANLRKIKGINKELLSPLLSKLVADIKSLDTKDIRIDEDEENAEERLKKIVQSLPSLMPANTDAATSSYIKSEIDTAATLEKLTKDLEDEEKEELKRLALVLSEIESLRKSIEEQDHVIDQLLEPRRANPLGTIFGKARKSREELAIELRTLISKEVGIHNAVLKDLGQISIQDEADKLRQICMFEEHSLKITQDLSYLMNQFLPLANRFTCGQYCIFQCNIHDLIYMATTGLFPDPLPVHTRRVYAGSHEVECRYHLFTIDSVTTFNPKGDVFIVFPLENILRGRVFFQHGKSILAMMVSSGIQGSDLKKDLKLFDMAEKDIDERFKQWCTGSKVLDDKFKERWSDDAEGMIQSQFSNKWLSEGLSEFTARNDIDLLSVLAMYRIFTDGSFAYEHMPHQDKMQAVTEYFRKLDKDKLKAELAKCKEFYGAIAADLDTLKATRPLALSDAVSIVPKRYILYMERLYEKAGRRPDTYYYADDKFAGLNTLLGEELAKTQKKEKIVPVNTRLFDRQTLNPLSTMKK